MAKPSSKAILCFVLPVGVFSVFWFLKRKFRFGQRKDHRSQQLVNLKLESSDTLQTVNMPIPASKTSVDNCEHIPATNGEKSSEMTSLKNNESCAGKTNAKKSQKNKSSKCTKKENGHQSVTNGVKNSVNELKTAIAQEASEPIVNGKVPAQNGLVEVTESIFSRLQNIPAFVPAQNAKNLEDSETQNTSAENTVNGDVSRTESEIQDEPGTYVQATEIAESFEQLTLDLPSADLPPEVMHSRFLSELVPADGAVVQYDNHYPNGFLLPGFPYQDYAVDSDTRATCSDSSVSEDSGRGLSSPNKSDPESEICMVYEFEIPSYCCGMMIGSNGTHVKTLLTKSGARVIVKRHPCSTDKKICSVTGSDIQIENALKLIRKKFPENQYPEITLEQLNTEFPVLACPKLLLPSNFEGVLTCTMTPGHFFLHQQTHPTFHQLHSLTAMMKVNYSQSAPMLENPSPGDICVATLQNVWYRAEVVQVFPDGQWCTLKFLDFGGYGNVPIAQIRQIRYDFMTLPFQAMECFLAGVEPIGESWSEEAKQSFEAMAHGRVLQGRVAGYMGNVPCVYLLVNVGTSMAYINQLMIDQGFAKPILNQCSEETSQQQ